MVSCAAGRRSFHKRRRRWHGIPGFGWLEIDFGAFSIFADIDLLDVIDGTDDVLCQNSSLDDF